MVYDGVSSAWDANWTPISPGIIWKRHFNSVMLPNTETHYQVPDLFAILHGIGLYDGN